MRMHARDVAVLPVLPHIIICTHSKATTSSNQLRALLSLQGYMPGQLYKLDSSYGNEQQLRDLLGKLKAAGIDPLADIVINHR